MIHQNVEPPCDERPASQKSVLFDTETTGLDPLNGDRVIEIACIELERDLPTGRTFHALVDPDREIPPEATRVHGFTRADLVGKPRFADITDDLLAFIADHPLVAHNAPFDFGFLDMEFGRLRHPPLARSRMICTLELAKARYPGLPNSLDALCRRFAIDLSERTSHNALLDCKLLAEVYVELTGGRQRGLLLEAHDRSGPTLTYAPTGRRSIRLVTPTEAQRAAHAAFLTRIKEPVWLT